jgi:hypothetical protein
MATRSVGFLEMKMLGASSLRTCESVVISLETAWLSWSEGIE